MCGGGGGGGKGGYHWRELSQVPFCKHVFVTTKSTRVCRDKRRVLS